MPIFIDMEDNSTIECGKLELTNQALNFCRFIENGSDQYSAGVYANLNWFKNYLDVSKLNNYKIWLAQYTTANNHAANFKVNMWQYSSTGKVTGITGSVDMNKCLDCEEVKNEVDITGKDSDFEVKLYQNGSTKEDVFQDVNCTTLIGYLNPYEAAECYGIVDNKAIVVYNKDVKKNERANKKVGFCKWLGGVK